MSDCPNCGGEETTAVGTFNHKAGCSAVMFGTGIREAGRILSTQPTTRHGGYEVRKCRGHFHVTISGMDLALLGDPFPTREAAQAVLEGHQLFMAKPCTVVAPASPAGKGQTGGVSERGSREVRPPQGLEETSPASPPASPALGEPDWARVIAWAGDPHRKPANTAFTAGAERQAAYCIEAGLAASGALRELSDEEVERIRTEHLDDLRDMLNNWDRAARAQDVGAAYRQAEIERALIRAVARALSGETT